MKKLLILLLFLSFLFLGGCYTRVATYTPNNSGVEVGIYYGYPYWWHYYPYYPYKVYYYPYYYHAPKYWKYVPPKKYEYKTRDKQTKDLRNRRKR